MQAFKNIAVGLAVSFIGSVPLGYLNVIGYKIYAESGMADLIPYLLGVILIEAVVIFATLVFADYLAGNKKLIRFIEVFSIFFMFGIAFAFYQSAAGTPGETSGAAPVMAYPAFISGIILSCLNFIQLPFWTAWNLYLINGGYISVKSSGKYSYLLGTLAGTFSGMLTLVLFLDLLTDNTQHLSHYLMRYIIPGFFAGMGFYQGFKFYRKYYSARSRS